MTKMTRNVQGQLTCHCLMQFLLRSQNLFSSAILRDTLSYKHTKRQRQRPMLVSGDAWKSVPDQFPIDQYWPLPLMLSLMLGVFIPLQSEQSQSELF